MNFLEYLIFPYQNYESSQILMEFIAAVSGVLSVVFAIRKNILVYPIGILSTGLYTLLLFQWSLYGEMAINFYYTIMSIYGWIQWSQMGIKPTSESKVERNTNWTRIGSFFILSFMAVLIVYRFKYSNYGLIPPANYLDALATSFFLVAMYLMARMRIENWYFWIVGNLISIPLFAFKGYGITAIQYVIFLGLAIQGWYKWNRNDQSL